MRKFLNLFMVLLISFLYLKSTYLFVSFFMSMVPSSMESKLPLFFVSKMLILFYTCSYWTLLVCLYFFYVGLWVDLNKFISLLQEIFLNLFFIGTMVLFVHPHLSSLSSETAALENFLWFLYAFYLYSRFFP